MKVSVVIGSYGSEEWERVAQERAFPSAQALDPHEILIGHDPDGTVATFRNVLAEKAEGDWLCFLDADDELSSNYLTAMENAYSRQREYERGTFLLTPATSYVRNGRKQRGRVLREADLRYMNWLIIGTLIPTDLFRTLGGFRDWPHGLEDWDLWTRAWKHGVEIVQVPKATYFAHWQRDSEHRKLFRQRGTQVYWHQSVGHDVWPDIYAPPTEAEIAAQSMTSLRYVEGVTAPRRPCGCRGGR